MSNVVEKTCTLCGVLKPITEFGKNQNLLRSRCKPCRSKVAVEWTKKHAEAHNARLRSWRARRPEVARAIVARYAKKNMAAMVEKNRKWRAENREKWMVIQRTWQAANRDKTQRAKAKRRAAEFLSEPSWADQEAIRKIYLESSKATAETGEPHEVDHIIPLNSPVVCGLHWEANLRVVPRSVNRSKGNRLHETQAA